jgi:lipoprotein
VFPRKWSSRTAIRSGSILPQNTVTAAFACRDGKHDFYACVDQKNHRIFRCQRNYPLKIQIILLSAGELVLHRSEKSYKLLWNHVSK